MNFPPLEERVKKLLDLVAHEIRPCSGCGTVIYIVHHHKTGKDAPYTEDAVNHFLNCPHAAEFRRRREVK